MTNQVTQTMPEPLGYISDQSQNGATYEMSDNDKQESFKEAALPLIKWLCENVHPHNSVIVTCTNAELLESKISTGEVLEFLKD